MHIPSSVLPLQDGLHVEDMEADGDVLTVTLTALAPSAACPLCATASSRLHSQYQRQATDLPWGALTLRLILRVRRFRCAVRDCRRRVFTERLPHLLLPYARRTIRAQEIVRAVAFALGGEAGARLIARLRLRVSAATLRRLIHCVEIPVLVPPRVIGVDDFALRRRQRYGTVIADLEEHKIIDLLPDRTAPTLAAWLDQQPQIEIVSRDRATEYARGITEGARQAVQVADRWHVLRNLREAAERVLDAHRAQWQDNHAPGGDGSRAPGASLTARAGGASGAAGAAPGTLRRRACPPCTGDAAPADRAASPDGTGHGAALRHGGCLPRARAPSAPTQSPAPLRGLSRTALG